MAVGSLMALGTWPLTLVQGGAMALAGASGVLLGQQGYMAVHKSQERLRRERASGVAADNSLLMRMVLFVCRMQEREQTGEENKEGRRPFYMNISEVRMELLKKNLSQAGLQKQVSPQAIIASRLRFAGGLGLMFAVLGLLVSSTLAACLLLLGGMVGWRLPEKAVAHRAQQVRTACNEEVPIMLEIIALASRAGMSFDRALQLYTTSFETPLARRCHMAQVAYQQGIASRAEALHQLAQSLDSVSLEHFAQTVNQATHFGVPLSEALEDLAHQIRQQEKALLAEEVSKAPVKMLIPMGLFILPAMLLLVMGPIVLNMLVGMS